MALQREAMLLHQKCKDSLDTITILWLVTGSATFGVGKWDWTASSKLTQTPPSHKQKDLVDELDQYLQNQGLVVWRDIREMSGNIVRSMVTAVVSSKMVLVCLSSDYEVYSVPFLVFQRNLTILVL